MTSKADKGPKRPRLNPFSDWSINVLILLFGTAMIAQPYVIPTGSMENNLLIGDHLIVDKLAYAPAGRWSGRLLPYLPVRRGDIVVFRYPVNLQETFVKRVVGVPGDRLRIVAKQLFVNGEAMREPYKIHKTASQDSYRDDFPSRPNTSVSEGALEMLRRHVRHGEIVVPPESFFVMGDNRDESLDSRYWGFVPRRNIIGKPLIIYWSYDAPTEQLVSPTIGLDHILDLTQNFFSKTRWKRTFMLIRSYPLLTSAERAQALATPPPVIN